MVTIAKFTSELIKQLWPVGAAPEVKRKADLLLIFGILKNKYFPDLGYEQFSQAYNLFSDLRSFTLNEDALMSVLDEQSEEVRTAVQLFWQLLSATGYLDEHGAYQAITESLRSAEEIIELKKTYIFWGFQHLNGQQIDLLKALSIRYQVVIPFPLALKDKLKKSDWTSWLRDSKVLETDLPLLTQSPKASWIKINSREISLNLQNLIKPHDQIVLGVSKLSPLHLDIVPSRNVFYKIPHQLIEAELNELSYDLKEELKSKKTFSDIELFLLNKKNEKLKEINKTHAFKYFKALELYQDAILLVKELTDEEIKVDRFFLKLLQDVVGLNQPRTSYVPFASHELNIDLKDMSSLEDVKRERRVVLCIDERFDEIQGLGQNYTETIQKALSALGPLKRSELELLFKKWELNDLFTQGEVIVLMSETTLKHSLIWKRLFIDVELVSVPNQAQINNRKITDHFKTTAIKSFSGSYSASKFQTFLDCPRKFYFNYVDKVFPSISLKNDFDSLMSGTISHKIIEIFHKNKSTIEELPLVVKTIMNEYITKEKIFLPQDKFLKHEIVFYQRSYNGIQFLKKIENILGYPVVWSMEEEFSFNEGYDLKGKIDCIGLSQNMVFLLDFKSTKYGASSNIEVEQLESLQLWTYAKAASKTIKDFDSKSVILGYISLDSPGDSNLLFTDSDLTEKFRAAKICKQQTFKTPFPELFKSAQEKMLEVFLAISSEKLFAAQPRKTDVCTFCELNKVCVKAGTHNE